MWTFPLFLQNLEFFLLTNKNFYTWKSFEMFFQVYSVFPKIGVKRTPKMDGLYIIENPYGLMDDLGGFHPLFSETS